MFGLEKKQIQKFDFDLEVEIKEDPKKAKEFFKKVENSIDEIKKKIKAETSKEILNNLGILLQGYIALLKVLKKSQKS